jgi:hypothetical protein
MESLAKQNQKLTEEVMALLGLVAGLVITTVQGTCRSRILPNETTAVRAASFIEVTEGFQGKLVFPEERLRQMHRYSNKAGNFAAF